MVLIQFAVPGAKVFHSNIGEIGPRCRYVAHRHTGEHMRDFALPLPVRTAGDSREDLQPEIGRAWDEAEVAARRELGRVLREHRPDPLPDDVLAALDDVLHEAEQDAAKGLSSPGLRG